MPTLQKKCCPTCGQSINEREITLFSGLVKALHKIWVICIQTNTNQFTRKQIKGLFNDENITARFGDWVMFGGLVRKAGKGNYILDMDKCRQFFIGQMAINSTAYKNPLTKTIRCGNLRTIDEIPHIKDQLDLNDEYIVRYR